MTARKPNGRSSVYLGKDGRWHGRVTMGVRDDGSPDRRHVRGATEGEVTRKVRAIERERSAGHAAKAGRPPTVGEWMRTWLDTIAPRTASASTITSTYRPKVDRWIIPRIGGHRLDRLRPEHLDALYLGLAGEGLAPKSVAMVHQLISRALKMAHRRGIVGRNVATLVDAPTFREAEIVPLTADDARRVLTAAAGERNGARWSVALALGLRQSEALGLRWSCLDLDRGEVRVYQLKRARYAHGCRDPLACTAGRHRDSCLPGCSLHAAYCPERTGGAWAFREPKGGKARTVVIPGQLLSPLRAQRTAQAAERLAAGELWQDWDLVFARPDGRPIDPSTDWQEWRRISAAAGVRDSRVHDARHTAATMLLEQGVDIRVVQDILGHSTLTVTRRYTHVTNTLARDAAERIGRTLWAN